MDEYDYPLKGYPGYGIVRQGGCLFLVQENGVPVAEVSSADGVRIDSILDIAHVRGNGKRVALELLMAGAKI